MRILLLRYAMFKYMAQIKFQIFAKDILSQKAITVEFK